MSRLGSGIGASVVSCVMLVKVLGRVDGGNEDGIPAAMTLAEVTGVSQGRNIVDVRGCITSIVNRMVRSRVSG